MQERNSIADMKPHLGKTKRTPYENLLRIETCWKDATGTLGCSGLRFDSVFARSVCHESHISRITDTASEVVLLMEEKGFRLSLPARNLS